MDSNIPHQHLQSTISPSSKYHTTLFRVPHHPLQSTTPPSSEYHTTLFKIPHHLLQSTTSPSLKYHTTLFKVQTYRINIANAVGCLGHNSATSNKHSNDAICVPKWLRFTTTSNPPRRVWPFFFWPRASFAIRIIPAHVPQTGFPVDIHVLRGPTKPHLSASNAIAVDSPPDYKKSTVYIKLKNAFKALKGVPSWDPCFERAY